MRHLGRTLITVAGLAAASYLVLQQGFDEVFRALHLAGWTGLGSITLLHIVPTFLCALAWWLLLRRHQATSLADYMWVRWIRDGLDSVMPLLPVSGELVAVRILGMWGVRLADASTIVDLTAELLGQVVFAAIGFVLLVRLHPHPAYELWLAAGIAVMALQFTGFLIAQKKGLFRLIEHPVRWLRNRRRRHPAPEPDDGPLHERLLTVYSDRDVFIMCLLLHVLAWAVGGLEAWLGLWFMGHPLGVSPVLAIEGLVLGARSLAFFVPLGAGVQEGAYVLLGGMLGLPPDLALAVSLLKRGRDLIIGVPALLFWQVLEARELGRIRSRGDVVN
jgi:putative membrane protein